MKKLFIFDSNPGEVGKSRSIKAIFHVLKQRRDTGKLMFTYKVLRGSDNFANKQDLKVLINYKEVTIGLESQGDPNSRLTTSIKEFAEEYKCAIIICACRTKGKDVREIKRICKKKDYITMSAPHIVIKHQDDSLYDCLAENYANSIIAAVDKWIELQTEEGTSK